MSRVFLAEDAALGRSVVIKVLPPEMSAELTTDRFAREVRVAASLQHPHLVPVLTAGAAAGVVYYIMPFIRGDSLATRLQREGALPVDDAVRILRDVTDALAHAHAQGVVHRDIKPANILLSGRHALVTDFGIAKAVTAAAGEGTALTGTGLALGTPAYMAPEQAAADPQLDHRADIYALGAIAYEMLAGRPPFSAPTPQAMLAAHVALAPEPVDRYRPGLPPALSALVMRALAKHPADRWQDADTVLAQLDAMRHLTPDSTVPVTAAAPAPAAPPGTVVPARVVALFLLVAVVLVAGAFAISREAGLPDWVWIATLAAMLAGLPIVIYTMRLERRRAELRRTGEFPITAERGYRRWFTWRRALTGGALAVGSVVLLSAAYAASRVLGIGPGATLISRGALARADRLVLADFENRTTDKSIGDAVTEALRVDLGQSKVAQLLDRREVSAALVRMGVRADTTLSERLARELALREGAKAIVAGDITRLGSGYVLTARIVTADSGATLAPVRVTAGGDGDLIQAVNRLSSDLRARIGESLRTIRGTDPLEQVTTASLPALRAYSEGSRAFDAGDMPGARARLERAVEIDTGFAMAWRKLSAIYFNIGEAAAVAENASRHAFEHRDRLPPLERYLSEGSYYLVASVDSRQKAADAFLRATDAAPDNTTALNNLALTLNQLGQFGAAESLLRPRIGPKATIQMADNFADALYAQGKWAAVDTLLAATAERFPPTHPVFVNMQLNLAAARRRYTHMDSLLRPLEQRPGGALPIGPAIFARGTLDEVQGHYARAERLAAEVADSMLLQGPSFRAAYLSLLPVYYDLARGQSARARQKLDDALAGRAFRGLDPNVAPYQDLAILSAALGDPAGVRRVQTSPAAARGGYWPVTDSLQWLALHAWAEQRWRAAATAFGEAHAMLPCRPCNAFYAAQMWDAANAPDSALAYYERGIDRRGVYFNDAEDTMLYPVALRRLGDLYDARGDRAKAFDYYQKFLDLWRTADPDLRPIVRDVEDRVSRLTAEPRAALQRR